MPGLPATAVRAVGQDDAIPDGFVVPFYLSDRQATDLRRAGRRQTLRVRRSLHLR